MTEPSPFRDNGPYADAVQAMKQFNAVTFGLPEGTNPIRLLDLVLGEALMMSGAWPSDFEVDYVKAFNEQVGLDPVATQILAAWLVRAYRAGYGKGRNSAEMDAGGRPTDADSTYPDEGLSRPER